LDLSYPPTQPLEIGSTPHERVSIHDVYIAYRQRFAQWFAITAPTSLIASFVLYAADQQIRSISRNFTLDWMRTHAGDIALATIVRYGSFFVAWFLGCIALAAIASELSGPGEEQPDTVWKSDAYQPAREHLAAIAAIAVATFAAFLVTTGALVL
jgi:hypothetical protein